MNTQFRHAPRAHGYGIVYLFKRRGGGLPMHDHTDDPALEHDVMCLAGAVLVYGPQVERCILRGGDHFVFDSRLAHEIVALEDGSAVLNSFKHGMPAGYDSLPEHELEGSIDLGPVQHETEGLPT